MRSKVLFLGILVSTRFFVCVYSKYDLGNKTDIFRMQGLLRVRTYVRYMITRPRANRVKRPRSLKNNAKNYTVLGPYKDGLRARYRLREGRVCGACARATSTRSSLFGPVQSRHSGTDMSASFLNFDFPLTPKTSCIVLTTGVVVSDVPYGRASIVSKHYTALQDPSVVR